jgi:predicted ATPase
MDLRNAERSKWLGALARRQYSTRLDSASLTPNSGPTLELSFSPGLSILAGGNGAGKTATLGAIARCLGASSDFTPREPEWLRRIGVRGATRGAEWDLALDFSSEVSGSRETGASAPNVFYIDPSADTERLLKRISTDDAPDDLLEGLDPYPLGDRELELLSFLLNRRYTSVSVYEVTAYSDLDEPDPYIMADCMGISYPLTRMGRGEFSAIYLVWRLSRMPAGSVVLLEEPESHLAYASQEPLIDVIIKYAIDGDLAIIMSTHSPAMIDRVPEGTVHLISALPTPIVHATKNRAEISRHLGLKRVRSISLVTEDVTAAHMLRALIDLRAPDVAPKCVILHAVNGESGVRRVATEVAESPELRFHPLLAVLDGDQRVGAARHEATLPGAASPEELIQSMLRRWWMGDLQDWSPRLLGGADRIRQQLDHADGRDHHDWLQVMAEPFGGNAPFLTAVVELILLDVELTRQVDEMLAIIRKQLHGN